MVIVDWFIDLGINFMKGGVRPNSGRKKGYTMPQTLEKQAIKKAFDQRVLRQADILFNSQFANAIGTYYVIRVDEIEDSKGNKKKVHELVEDINEILEVMNSTDGQGGTVNDDFYIVATRVPDNKAIDSLLDRAFGKATNHLEVTNTNPELETALTFIVNSQVRDYPKKNQLKRCLNWQKQLVQK